MQAGALALIALGLCGCGDDERAPGDDDEKQVTVAGKLPGDITFAWDGDASIVEVADCMPHPCEIVCEDGYPLPSTGGALLPWIAGVEWGDFETKLDSPMTYGVIDGVPDPSAVALVAGRTYAVTVTDYGPCDQAPPEECAHADSHGCAVFTP